MLFCFNSIILLSSKEFLKDLVICCCRLLLRRRALTLAVWKLKSNKSEVRHHCASAEKKTCCILGKFCVQVNFLLSICLWCNLNTLQMVSSRNKGEPFIVKLGEIINLVNH